MSAAKAKPVELSEAQIAVRAYERWVGRGCPISDGVEDWLAARGELEAELAQAMRTGPRRKSSRRAKQRSN